MVKLFGSLPTPLHLHVCSLLVVCLVSVAQATEPLRIVLIGDSTVKNGSGRGEGNLWGWGQVLADHFDTSRVVIENRALGGRSSRTYLTEGLWDRSLERLRAGDFVLMQFGHNDGGELFAGNRPRASLKGNGDESRDGVVEMSGKAEVVHTYGWYLRKYIADARQRGAIPIVFSPVPRNRWQEGRVLRASADYGRWAREAAGAGGALFIDLNEIVARKYEELGQETTARDLFTAADWTHTTEAGARVNAACVAEGIRTLDACPLRGYLLAQCVVEGIRASKLPLATELRDDLANFDPGEPIPFSQFAIPPSPRHDPGLAGGR